MPCLCVSARSRHGSTESTATPRTHMPAATSHDIRTPGAAVANAQEKAPPEPSRPNHSNKKMAAIAGSQESPAPSQRAPIRQSPVHPMRFRAVMAPSNTPLWPSRSPTPSAATVAATTRERCGDARDGCREDAVPARDAASGVPLEVWPTPHVSHRDESSHQNGHVRPQRRAHGIPRAEADGKFP